MYDSAPSTAGCRELERSTARLNTEDSQVGHRLWHLRIYTLYPYHRPSNPRKGHHPHPRKTVDSGSPPPKNGHYSSSLTDYLDHPESPTLLWGSSEGDNEGEQGVVRVAMKEPGNQNPERLPLTLQVNSPIVNGVPSGAKTIKHLIAPTHGHCWLGGQERKKRRRGAHASLGRT